MGCLLRPFRLPIAELLTRRAGPAAALPEGVADRLADIADFGPNPGNLRMRVFLPPGLPPGAPLLVALHGCTQTAAGFDHGCGWSDLAATHRFALLLPEQRQANNPGHCLNWFNPADIRRGQGEAGSIEAMVAHLLATRRLDPARIFVTGLSAGGAMATVMLATCPDLFAAGAIVAGLPFGAAAGVQQAFEAMAGRRIQPAQAWAARVRAAAPPGRTAWPRVAVWQGEADRTVNPANAAELVKQWAALHAVDPVQPGAETSLAWGQRRAWPDAQGRILLQANTLPGFGHGVPIDPGSGAGHIGRPMPFILPAGVPAPLHIAAFFGLIPPPAPPPAARTTRPGPLRWLMRRLGLGG